jgi:hypothetical protein
MRIAGKWRPQANPCSSKTCVRSTLICNQRWRVCACLPSKAGGWLSTPPLAFCPRGCDLAEFEEPQCSLCRASRSRATRAHLHPQGDCLRQHTHTGTHARREACLTRAKGRTASRRRAARARTRLVARATSTAHTQRSTSAFEKKSMQRPRQARTSEESHALLPQWIGLGRQKWRWRCRREHAGRLWVQHGRLPWQR